ncbi:MAG: hypothetical protein ABUK08_00245 [Candidatus Humimicrobiaceae bacterium]
MDGKLKSLSLYTKKSFDGDYKVTNCPFKIDENGNPKTCYAPCVMFGEPKTTADGKTEIDICNGKTLVFNTFTIE